MKESKFKCVWKDSIGCMYEKTFTFTHAEETARDILFTLALSESNRFLIENILIPGERVPELYSVEYME